MPTDPRDHVPDELRQGEPFNLFDALVALPEPESELDLLANAMDQQALALRFADSLPRVQDMLIRGAAAIRQLQGDLYKSEDKAATLESVLEECADYESRYGASVRDTLQATLYPSPQDKHFQRMCAEHGSLLTQCRCSDSHKRVERVPCPGRGRCPGAPR